MGLDRRNWRKPYTEDELKSMLAAGEMLQLRQRVQELEQQLTEVRKQERERCAKVCMSLCRVIEEPHEFERCAEAIRAME